VKHLLIPPKQLGIEKWHPGDYAVYKLKTNTENRSISFSVVTQAYEGSGRHWLRTEGLLQFNAVNIAVWTLQNESSLRPGSETDGFCDPGGHFLFPFFSPTFPRYPIHLEYRGDESVQTPIGTLKCQNYFVYIRSPNGKLVPLLELWSNLSVRPLGIVQARWRDETLNLVNVKPYHPIEIPVVLSETSNLKKIREQGCAQCHHQGIGGENLKIVAMDSIIATTFNLTQCLFHYYQSGLVNREEPLQFQLISNTRRVAGEEVVQFTWTKGSFWIETNQRGQLTLTLDAFASQGDLRVIPQTGFLVLTLRE